MTNLMPIRFWQYFKIIQTSCWTSTRINFCKMSEKLISKI